MSLDTRVIGGCRATNRVLCHENCFCSFSHHWLKIWTFKGASYSAAIEFQLENGTSLHKGLLTLTQPKLLGPKPMSGQLPISCSGSSKRLSESSSTFKCTPSQGPVEKRNQLPLFTELPEGICEWTALRSCWCLVGNLWNTFCLESILYVPCSIFSLSLFFCTWILMRKVVAVFGPRFPLLSHLRLNFHV